MLSMKEKNFGLTTVNNVGDFFTKNNIVFASINQN